MGKQKKEALGVYPERPNEVAVEVHSCFTVRSSRRSGGDVFIIDQYTGQLVKYSTHPKAQPMRDFSLIPKTTKKKTTSKRKNPKKAAKKTVRQKVKKIDLLSRVTKNNSIDIIPLKDIVPNFSQSITFNSGPLVFDASPVFETKHGVNSEKNSFCLNMSPIGVENSQEVEKRYDDVRNFTEMKHQIDEHCIEPNELIPSDSIIIEAEEEVVTLDKSDFVEFSAVDINVLPDFYSFENNKEVSNDGILKESDIPMRDPIRLKKPTTDSIRNGHDISKETDEEHVLEELSIASLSVDSLQEDDDQLSEEAHEERMDFSYSELKMEKGNTEFLKKNTSTSSISIVPNEPSDDDILPKQRTFVEVFGNPALEYPKFDYTPLLKRFKCLSCFLDEFETEMESAIKMANVQDLLELNEDNLESFYTDQLIPAIKNLRKYRHEPDEFHDCNAGKMERVFDDEHDVIHAPLSPRPEIFPFQIEKRAQAEREQTDLKELNNVFEVENAAFMDALRASTEQFRAQKEILQNIRQHGDQQAPPLFPMYTGVPSVPNFPLAAGGLPGVQNNFHNIQIPLFSGLPLPNPHPFFSPVNIFGPVNPPNVHYMGNFIPASAANVFIQQHQQFPQFFTTFSYENSRPV